MAKQQPTRTAKHDGHHDYIEEHPAYGQIGASRVSSSEGQRLYGSDFSHRGFVMITIARSQMARGISHDWYHDRDELIRVALSEAQWATFVSTLNSGTGTPCTIERLGGLQVPDIEVTEDRREQFTQELRQTIADGLGALDDLSRVLDSMKLSGVARVRLSEQIEKARRELTANVPYVVESAGKHIEQNLERARVEVHAHIQGAIHAAGLEALHAGAPDPIELPGHPGKVGGE